MFTLWIGDTRIKQLKQNNESADLSVTDCSYMVDDYAEYSWFENNAIPQLPLITLAQANIVIMLGFIDCVYSCIWDAFNINKIANKYVNAINDLIEQYPSSTFFVCSVSPVDRDFPFADYKDGLIPKTILNNKIDKFNNTIKTCGAKYLDCHSYLTTTGFETRDAARFNPDTCKALLEYITSFFTVADKAAFIPRLHAPEADDDAFIYWTSVYAPHNGYNTYPLIDDDKVPDGYKNIGSTLPNCTAYAWGRFYEIIGEKPKLLAHNNAEEWFLADGSHPVFAGDGYKRGDTPELGAVMCWSKGNPDGTQGGADDGAGHVAIVEQINKDGSVTTSESGWGSAAIWSQVTRTKGSDGNWGMSSAYTFQGFIYCPAVTPTPAALDVNKSQVTTHTGITTKEEREINAKYIYKYLGSRGWTLNAVAGLLGNLEHESWINPGVTELGGTGFGLVQWTPPSKFTKWCDAQNPPLPQDDVDSQLARIEHERDPNNTNNGVCTPTELRADGCSHSQYLYRTKDSYGDNYAVTFTPKTFDEFATSTKSPYDLACAFLYNYECPGSICWGASSYAEGKLKTVKQREARREITRKERGESAEKWYEFLAPYAKRTIDDFIATGLKINRITPTEVSASFIARGATIGHYKIINNSGKTVDSGNLNSKLRQAVSELKIVSFHSDKQALIPNQQYTLVVSLASGKDSDHTTETMVDFVTPQDYPSAVNKLELIAKDKNLPHDNFQLTVDDSNLTWGYWKKPQEGGFTVQLIINGQVKKEKEAGHLTKDFKISEYFDYNKIKIGETIQIGIRTWVKDNNGTKIFDSDHAKCSNPISMLKKSVLAYLNID